MPSRSSSTNQSNQFNGATHTNGASGPPSPVIPTPSSPTLSTSTSSSSSSKKLPKFLQSRSKVPKGKEIPVPINPSAGRRSSLVEQHGSTLDSPSTSPSSEESSNISTRSPLRTRPTRGGSNPLPIPQAHRPVSPSPLNDTSLPTRISSWISNSSTSNLSLPNILTSHSNITKHLSLSSPNRRRLSLTAGSGKNSAPSSPVSDGSSVSSKIKDKDYSKKGKHRQVLDKAVRYFLDTDAGHDGSTEDIWLLGEVYTFPSSLTDGLPVESPQQEQPDTLPSPNSDAYNASSPPSSYFAPGSPPRQRAEGILSSPPAHLRTSTAGSSGSSSGHGHDKPPVSPSSRASRFLHHSHRDQVPTTPRASSFAQVHDEHPPVPAEAPPPLTFGYPTPFYEDFSSRVWLTYRGGWDIPLRADAQLHDLPAPPRSTAQGNTRSASSLSVPLSSTTHSSVTRTSATSAGTSTSQLSSSTSSKHNVKWGNNLLATFGIGSKEFTSDSGWGCMLRTGQCVLAEALVRIHLGRGFRRGIDLSPEQRHVYAQLLTWFMDTPSPLAPFSVHRMALAGKVFGKEVGTWFGPSTAAGAIKTLVGAFPEAGLGVCVATDSMVYQTDVIQASRSPAYLESHHRSHSGGTNRSSRFRHRHHHQGEPTSPIQPDWGDRPVLVLFGIRLGLDGVNPIYYESLKQLYAIPQGVGIAGGRPSSSYWFIGVQGDSLIYLDPHYARQAVGLKELDPSLPPLALDELYSEEELGTFHCDRIRKMALSSMDPSMLVGFVVKDRQDWDDLRRRLGQLPKSIGLYIQDERPAWHKDGSGEDDSLLESISDSASNVSDDRLDEPSNLSHEDAVSPPIEPVPRRGEDDESLETAETAGLNEEQPHGRPLSMQKIGEDWEAITPGAQIHPATFEFPSKSDEEHHEEQVGHGR